jgi:hypothetical protein
MLHAKIFGVDLVLQSLQQLNRAIAEFFVNPRIAVVGVRVGGFPQIARALHEHSRSTSSETAWIAGVACFG